jgi:hypothetical protein
MYKESLSVRGYNVPVDLIVALISFEDDGRAGQIARVLGVSEGPDPQVKLRFPDYGKLLRARFRYDRGYACEHIGDWPLNHPGIIQDSPDKKKPPVLIYRSLNGDNPGGEFMRREGRGIEDLEKGFGQTIIDRDILERAYMELFGEEFPTGKSEEVRARPEVSASEAA